MVAGLVEGRVRCFGCSHPLGQNSRRSRAPQTQGGLAESHQVLTPEVHGRSPLDDGFDALPAGAFGVNSLHDDAHQQDDQN